MEPPPPHKGMLSGGLHAGCEGFCSESDDWLAASGLWVLGLDWRCGPCFPGVLCTRELPEPQDLLFVPAQRAQD